MMAARNLALAEAQGLDVLTLCSACTGTLTEANHRLKQDARLRDWADEQLAEMGHTYKGTVRVRHFARMLYEEIGVETLRELVTVSLADFGFAPHYGCHYLKPSHLYDGFDDPENPQSLDQLIEATGAHVVRYEDEADCCGGGILGFDEEMALLVTKRKLDHVTAARADGLVLICPFCAIMYEANQRRVEKLYEVEYKLPVLYYPQLLGLAMGFSLEEMGFKLNRVKPRGLIKRMSEWTSERVGE
ncbi:MAG: CoB--CoM heterodisulfide reductase iron-sulfur subunit B family protein [Chloroflexota bacterium]|nr:CoB--CoM heterodisulfide reductase iron-sulfur subunit B family protein [Chloroflexota bacterium]